MTAGFVPPGHWTETASQLRQSGQVTLNSAGVGTISFSTDSGNQRWVVTGISVNTNQLATASVVPFAVVALNTTDYTQLSPSNQLGAISQAGNNDSFGGAADVDPADFISVMFYPPPGSTAPQIAVLAGVIASVTVSGTKYTRRG